MQTFVPMGISITDNARVLDYRRLGKQRVEAWQILNALRGGSKGWVNHPATRMWRGYEPALALYGAVMCVEWKERGYKDTMLERFFNIFSVEKNIQLPEWLFDSNVTLSHKSNLIRKFPEHYAPLWPDVPNDLPYVWPVP